MYDLTDNAPLSDGYRIKMHIHVVSKFKRRRVISQGLDYLWDKYLTDVSNLQKYNPNIKYLLIAIDIFSWYLWAALLYACSNIHIYKDKLQDFVKDNNHRPHRSLNGRTPVSITKWTEVVLKIYNRKLRQGFLFTP